MEKVTIDKLLKEGLPKPESLPDLRTYKLEKWKALARSPKKLLNYLKYVNSTKRSELVKYLPIKLDIENVSRCNFRCTMCQVSDWPGLKRANDMSFEDFKKIIDKQYGLIEIKLQGMGEPLLQKDEYFKMISYARSKHIWVRTTTNASLLHLNKNYEKLIDSRVNEVQISIDGAKKETFEKIRRGSNFEKVVENCKLINNYCKSKNIERTKMWVVVQKDNITELEELVKLSGDMSFTSLVFSLDLTDWGQESWNKHVKNVMLAEDFDLERAANLINMGKERGIKVAFWNIIEKYETTNKNKLCPWPFERAYVSSDLRIVPCCMIANPEVHELGDAKEFSKEWNGKKYQEFRKAHLEGNIPTFCKGCYKKND